MKLDSPMDRIRNQGPTQSTEWLRIADDPKHKSSDPEGDPGSGTGGDQDDAAEPAGDSSTKSD